MSAGFDHASFTARFLEAVVRDSPIPWCMSTRPCMRHPMSPGPRHACTAAGGCRVKQASVQTRNPVTFCALVSVGQSIAGFAYYALNWIFHIFPVFMEASNLCSACVMSMLW